MRRRRQTEEDLEYLEKRPKSVQRRKANPELRLADLLERIINATAAAPEVGGGSGIALCLGLSLSCPFPPSNVALGPCDPLLYPPE